MVLDARLTVSSTLSTTSWLRARFGQDGNQRGCFLPVLSSPHSCHVTGNVGDHRRRMLAIRHESRTALITVQCIAVTGRKGDCFDLVVPMRCGDADSLWETLKFDVRFAAEEPFRSPGR
jgi:hypothetical protein